jgi:hypothetical protein
MNGNASKKYSAWVKKSVKNYDSKAGRIVVFISKGSCFERCGCGS